MSEIGIQLRSTESSKVRVHTSSLDLLRSVRLSIFLCSINHDAELYPSRCIYSQSHNSSSIRMYACVVYSAYVHKSAFLPLFINLPSSLFAGPPFWSADSFSEIKRAKLQIRSALRPASVRVCPLFNLSFFSPEYAKRLCISALGESLLWYNDAPHKRRTKGL